jgi:multidrug efflux pump subunit AcrB
VAGALGTLYLRRISTDVYTQIGLVMLIGLAAMNAILIVQFAKVRHQGGMALVDSALEAAMLRLRPVLMTSFVFILGACLCGWRAARERWRVGWSEAASSAGCQRRQGSRCC